MEDKFLHIANRLSSKRAMYAAHRMIQHISTPVLMSSGMDLAHRAIYLHNNNKTLQADYNSQLANQIDGLLESRGVNTEKLREKIEEGAKLFE